MKKTNKKYSKNFYIGIGITGFMLLFVLLGAFWTPYNTETMNAADKLCGMTAKHPFGCDNFGRDILSRIMKGAGTTFLVALGTVSLGTVVGTIIGALTGYFGGIVDEILMRIIDSIFAFPSILLALVFIALLGPGTWQVVIALGIAFVPSFSRIVRSEYLKQKNMDYVRNAALQGAGHCRIMFVHILPNVLPVLLSSIMIGFNNAVLAEAGMSFLGIGVQPPFPSLGRMLSEAQGYLFSAPEYAIFTGLTIILMVLGVALLGEVINKE